MNELIKTTKNEQGELLVSGRELHEFLEVKTKYADWMKRMIEYGFVENVDFSVFLKNEPDDTVFGGVRKITDHALKIDMAKEISMIQRNEKGKEARQYFIEVEKKYKAQQPKLPTTYKEALLALVEEVERSEQLQLDNQIKDQQIAEMQPKVTYVDMVLQCTDLLTTTQIADDYGMSAQRFNKLLHEQGIQYKQSGQWLLYAKYKGEGYTKSDTIPYKRTDGSEGISILTKWTQKGRLFLYETLKANDILPTMEKIKLTLVEKQELEVSVLPRRLN